MESVNNSAPFEEKKIRRLPGIYFSLPWLNSDLRKLI